MNDMYALLDLLGLLVLDPGTGVLIALLLVAAWTDWRTMRIPNWLTVSGMAYGLAFNAAHATSVPTGLLFGGLGLLVGLALLLPLYALRVLGAGDVKLMAMVGAFLGALATLKAVAVVFAFGGIAALFVVLLQRAHRQFASNLRDMAWSAVLPGASLWRPEQSGASVGKLPYGISICCGTILFITARHLGFA